MVVREAPWRVYDQIEIFIHPSQISLTHNFYKQWKVFFFENNPFTETDIKQGQSQMYNFLTTAKVIQRQIANATKQHILPVIATEPSAQNEPDPFNCESSDIEQNPSGHSSDFL